MSLLWKLLLSEYRVAILLPATAVFARPSNAATRQLRTGRRDGPPLAPRLRQDSQQLAKEGEDSRQ